MKMLRFVLVALALLMVGNMYAQRKGGVTPYHKNKGSILIGGGYNFFAVDRSTTLPVFFNPEYMVIEGLSVGVRVQHFQYKHFLQDSTPTDYFTEWHEESNDVRYNHLTISLDAKYYLNSIIEKGINKKIPWHYSFYVTGNAGYNIVTIKNENQATTNPDLEKQAVRLGAGIGARYQYSKPLAFFAEATLNSYSYANAGITLILGK